VDDDNFIDDTGVDPAIGYGNDEEPRSPDAPQVNILSFNIYHAKC
jgi:transcription factor SPN1